MARERRPQDTDKPSAKTKEKESGEVLSKGEKIIAKFHPHPLSFVRWFLPSILLAIWTVYFLVAAWLKLPPIGFFQDLLNNNSGLAEVVTWGVVAVLIGLILPTNPKTSKENVSAKTFLRAVRVVYWVLVVLPIVLFSYLTLQKAGDYRIWIYLYAGLISALIVLIYDLYRRSFTYFITTFRIIFRYRFFKAVERTIRFSKVEDVEVSRTLLQRIFKLGNVRPYTGSEESIVDLTPGYDSPDECFFGVRNPEMVKRLILEQMLGPQDLIQDSVYRTDVRAPGPGPAMPPAPPAAQAAAASAPARDDDRVRRLQEELDALRRERTQEERKPVRARVAEEEKRPPQAPAPAQAPFWREPAARPAPEARGRLSEITPTKGVSEGKPEHAEVGDDLDLLRSAQTEFRDSPSPAAKKPAPKDTSDDEDKPRAI